MLLQCTNIIGVICMILILSTSLHGAQAQDSRTPRLAESEAITKAQKAASRTALRASRRLLMARIAGKPTYNINDQDSLKKARLQLSKAVAACIRSTGRCAREGDVCIAAIFDCVEWAQEQRRILDAIAKAMNDAALDRESGAHPVTGTSPGSGTSVNAPGATTTSSVTNRGAVEPVRPPRTQRTNRPARTQRAAAPRDRYRWRPPTETHPVIGRTPQKSDRSTYGPRAGTGGCFGDCGQRRRYTPETQRGRSRGGSTQGRRQVK